MCRKYACCSLRRIGDMERTLPTGMFNIMVKYEHYVLNSNNQDGPIGVRAVDYTTAFPAGINAAATWQRSLIRERGYAMGEEFRGKELQSLDNICCLIKDALYQARVYKRLSDL